MCLPILLSLDMWVSSSLRPYDRFHMTIVVQNSSFRIPLVYAPTVGLLDSEMHMCAIVFLNDCTIFFLLLPAVDAPTLSILGTASYYQI